MPVLYNENMELQYSKDGLSNDKNKAAHLELFIKLVRNTPIEIISENVSTILMNTKDSEIIDSVDGLLRQLAMTRSFRISTGKGEKKLSHLLMLEMYKYMPNLMGHIIPIICKEIGCWKDLLKISTYCIEKDINHELIKNITSTHCNAIKEGDYLATKWAPRENSSFKKVAKIYVKYIYGNSKQDSYKNYRKLIKENNKEHFILETEMCKDNWDYIGDKLPNLTAINHVKYKKAFNRNIQDKYFKYLNEVSENKNKLNTTGLHIDGIVKTMLGGNATYGAVFNTNLSENEILLMNLQWKKFEDDMVNILLEDEDTFSTFSNQISVIDRSGSMDKVSSAAVAIGLFISKTIGIVERKKYGEHYTRFGDVVIRFSDNAEIINLTPTNNFNEYLDEYITKENKFNCGYSTNIMNVHSTIVNHTKLSKLKIAPDLIIMTDMQYNEICYNYYEQITDISSNEKINEFYKKNDIIKGETRCWNLRGDTKTFESSGEEDGVIMISGFNQNMLSLFIEGKKLSKNNGNTWDAFKAAQQQYDIATQWLKSGINNIKDKNNLSTIERQLVNTYSDKYISSWIGDMSFC